MIVTAGKDAFLRDRTRQLAAEAILHHLGEIVARLPAETVADHPEVAWRAIRGMRNVVAHQYQSVDYEIVWTALAERLPGDASAIESIVGDRGRPDG